MAKKKIYFNNNEKLIDLVDKDDLIAHNNDENAHQEALKNYTVSSPIGLWKAYHSLGENIPFDDESTKGFASLGSFVATYNAKDVFNNQPSQYGQLLNIPTIITKSNTYNDVYRVTQLWFDTDLNELYIRTGTEENNLKEQAFNRIAMESDMNTKSGTAFPVTNTGVGELFYRTDLKLLYLMTGIDDNGINNWVPIFDPQYPAGTAKKLTNPWFKLDSSDNDDSIETFSEGDNLNDFYEAEVYTSETEDISKTLFNSPTKNPFRLVVMQNTDGVGLQILFDVIDDKIYTRKFITVTNTDESKSVVYGAWIKFIDKYDTIYKAERAIYDKNGRDIVDTYATKSEVSTAYIYRGTVNNYSDLPTKNLKTGDIYNIVNEDKTNHIDAGDNVAWNGTTWDNLSGIVNLSAYAVKSELASSFTTKALTVNGNETVSGTLTVKNGIVGSLTGNATSANKVNSTLTVSGLVSGSFNGSKDVTIDIPKNTPSSTKLQTARKIGITGKVVGDGVEFDGTKNININTTSVNADTSTKLTNARTIQTKLDSTTAESFDGTANITPGVSGVLPIANGGTGTNNLNSIKISTFVNDKNYVTNTDLSDGTSGSATKLATARTIQTKLDSTTAESFDGTANVTPGVTGVLAVKNGGTGVSALTDLKNTFLLTSEVGNSVSKVPRYNSSGHLVLPSGAELWVE